MLPDLCKLGILGRDITELEVAKAMGAMARGKSAGGDGIPTEFWQEAWVGEGTEWAHALIGPVTRACNQVFRCGYIDRWKVGVVCPVPKKQGAVERMIIGGLFLGQPCQSYARSCCEIGCTTGPRSVG